MAFIVECVEVMMDNHRETVENMVDVMVFVECWYIVWRVGGLS